jgi:hypothetical protein
VLSQMSAHPCSGTRGKAIQARHALFKRRRYKCAIRRRPPTRVMVTGTRYSRRPLFSGFPLPRSKAPSAHDGRLYVPEGRLSRTQPFWLDNKFERYFWREGQRSFQDVM